MPTITGMVYPGHRSSQVGPFESGGLLYTVGLNGSGALTVFRSSDGSSWTAVASSITLGATHGLTALISGTTLFIGYPNAFITYALGTNTFGTANSTGQVVLNDVSANAPLFMVRRSNGHIVLLRQGPAYAAMGTTYRRVVIDYFNGSTWTTNTNVDGGGTSSSHADARALFVDSLDRVWVGYTKYNNSSIYSYKLIEPGSTALSAEFSGPTTSASNNYPVGAFAEFTAASAVHVGAFLLTSSSVASYITAASSASPTFAGELIAPTNTNFTSSNSPVLVNDGTDKMFYFRSATDGNLYFASQSTVGGAFDTETLFAAGTVQGVSARTLPSNKIGIAYNNNGTVVYEAHSLGPPPSAGPVLELFARGR